MSGAHDTAGVDRRARTGHTLGWLALTLVLGGALARASVGADPFPHWDSDPLRVPSVMTGWGPTIRTVLDVLALSGLACAVIGAGMTGTRVRTRLLLLLGAGVVGVVTHAWFLPGHQQGARGDLEDLIIGGAWAAALGGAVAMAHLRGRARRIGLAVGLGFVVMLAGKGAVQRYVEHPLTMRDYQAQRETILAARGWHPDSPQALAYERRLSQNDATGWFGLSNVYATFGALGLVACAGLGVGAVRGRDRRAGVLLALGCACSLAMLVMSHSKGGIGAAGIGAGVMLLVASGRGRWRSGMLAVVPAGVVAIVIARGLLGERLGELSLLFRWQYMQGAARVILDHPALGVGPSGFKEAYLLARPPLGVEEVTSPHNALLDWVTALGAFGLAWSGLGLLLALGAGRGAATPGESGASTASREDALIITLAGAAVTGVSALTESAMATPESSVMRLLALGGWVAVGVGVVRALRLSPHWTRAALAGGAAVVAAHSMIEVTPVWANAAPLLGALLGLLCGGEPAPTDRPSRMGRGLGLGVPLVGAAALAVGLAPLMRWERSLNDAAAQLRPVTSVRDRLERVGAGVGLAGDSVPALRSEIAAMLGEPEAASPAQLQDQLSRLHARAGTLAFERLTPALDARPTHLRTARAAARLALGLAELDGAEHAQAWRDRGVALVERVSDAHPGSANAWAALGSISHGAWSQSQRPEDLGRAVAAWERAAALDPLSLNLCVRLADANERLGRAGEASAWADRALELDELKRLNPVRRLSDPERTRLGRMTGGPARSEP